MIKKSCIFTYLFLMTSFAFILSDDAQTTAKTNIPKNTWEKANLEYKIPEQYQPAHWSTSDGYCGSVYRTKTGTILSRTGIESKGVGLNPGYYSNTQLEWDLSTNKVEVIDVFNWAGGSGGGGKLLPNFQQSPTPAPRHTYDGMTYVPDEDAMYLMLGANWKICLTKETTNEEAIKQLELDNNSTWKYSFADKKWTRIDGNIRQFWGVYRVSAYESHLRYWPEGKKIMFFADNSKDYAEFDLATQKWEKVELPKDFKMTVSAYGAKTTWDSKRGLWIFRLGPKVGAFDPKTKTFTALPNCWEMPAYPTKAEQEELKKNKQEIDKRYAWKSITYNSKQDVYMITGPTGNDTRVYKIDEKKWVEVKGGDIALPNGYLEYDAKSDLTGLVYQHSAHRFYYSPE